MFFFFFIFFWSGSCLLFTGVFIFIFVSFFFLEYFTKVWRSLFWRCTVIGVWKHPRMDMDMDMDTLVWTFSYILLLLLLLLFSRRCIRALWLNWIFSFEIMHLLVNLWNVAPCWTSRSGSCHVMQDDRISLGISVWLWIEPICALTCRCHVALSFTVSPSPTRLMQGECAFRRLESLELLAWRGYISYYTNHWSYIMRMRYSIKC